MKDGIREKIYEEISKYNNGDFEEVCAMEEEYSLEYLLIFIWQNGAHYLNIFGGHNTIEEFRKLFKKNKRRTLYRGIEFSYDEPMPIDVIKKDFLCSLNENAFLSFTDLFSVANRFAFNFTNIGKYRYHIIISCEVDEYIDVKDIRDLEENEFIVQSKNVNDYKLELCRQSIDISDF